MNLDELVNKQIDQYINEQLKDSKLKKAKEFVERYYPKIAAPIYFGLESLLLSRVESVNASLSDSINSASTSAGSISSSASVTGNILIDSVIGALFVYAGLHTHQHRNDKAINIERDIESRGIWRILDYPIPAAALAWGLVHNEMIRFNIYLLSALFNEHRIEPRYGEYVILEPSLLMPSLDVERIGFINYISDYVSRSLAYMSVALVPFVGITQTVFDSFKQLSNPEQRKVTWLSTTQLFNLFTGNHKIYLEISSEIEELSKEDYTLNLAKAYSYSMMGDDNNAFFELKKACEKLPFKDKVKFGRYNVFIESMSVHLTDFLETLQLRRRLIKAKKEGNFNNDIALLYCNRAYRHKILGKHSKSIKIFEEAIGIFPDMLELKVLYAEELETGNDDEKRKAVEIHKSIYQKIEGDEKYKQENCGETTKQVRQISPETSKFLNATYIYKQDSRDEIEKANANLGQAREVYGRTLEELMRRCELGGKRTLEPVDRNDAKNSESKQRIFVLQKLGFTEDLLVIDYDNKMVQVMRRSIGQTLLEKINNSSVPETEEVTNQILTLLAFIHAKMPVDGKATRKSKQYFEERVSRLGYEYSVESKIIDKLYRGYIEDKRLIPNYVFNKDAHPENWIIETGLIPELRQERIIAIDWDEKGTIEQAQELVNLLNYSGKMGWEFRIDAAKHYFREYSYFRNIEKSVRTDGITVGKEIIQETLKEVPTIEEQELFVLKYLNSVYERAVALCFAWSSPSRPRIQPLRAQILTNALESISVIKKLYSDFYIDHCTEFVRRESGLAGLRKEFETNK